MENDDVQQQRVNSSGGGGGGKHHNLSSGGGGGASILNHPALGSLALELSEQDVGNENDNWIPWASRLAGLVPASFLPWISAAEFGIRGWLNAKRNPEWPLEWSVRAYIALQEAIGGYHYGRGIAAFIRESGSTEENRSTLSETDIAFAALVVWHETSMGQMGSAVSYMMPWVIFNYHFYDGGRTYDQMLTQSWVSTKGDIFGLERHADFDTDAILVQHNYRMENDETYRQIYEATASAAQLYVAGGADPTNQAIGITHLADWTQSPVNWSRDESGNPFWWEPSQEDWKQSWTIQQQVVNSYYDNPENMGSANDLRLYGSFIRIEPEGPITWVPWQFLIWTP